MNSISSRCARGVKILTLCSLIILSGCATLEPRFVEPCKTRAYVETSISGFVSSRYPSHAPVRMAVIPFTVPANLTAFDITRSSLAEDLARSVHAELLRIEALPIVEVFPREDWPGKREEFFTGNYGALTLARQAGYDLVLVGFVEPFTSLERMTAYAKVIEIASGITLFYGKTEVNLGRSPLHAALEPLGVTRSRSDKVYTGQLASETARCIVQLAFADELAHQL